MAKLIIGSGILIVALLCTGVDGQSEPGAEAGKEKSPTVEVKIPGVAVKNPAGTVNDPAGTVKNLAVAVKSVSGSAEVREKSDKAWRAVKVKDVYHEGAEIRTGYKGKVELAFEDNSYIVINRVSYFKVDKFRRSGNKVITRNHLAYGKIQAGVEKGPAFSDYKISTSLGTLGVNGTRDIYLYVDPGSGQGIICLSQEGSIGWNTGRGSDCHVNPGGCTDQKGTAQYKTKGQVNNVGLVPIGSTGAEIGVGNNYGNQGNNSYTPLGDRNDPHPSTTGPSNGGSNDNPRVGKF